MHKPEDFPEQINDLVDMRQETGRTTFVIGLHIDAGLIRGILYPEMKAMDIPDGWHFTRVKWNGFDCVYFWKDQQIRGGSIGRIHKELWAKPFVWVTADVGIIP